MLRSGPIHKARLWRVGVVVALVVVIVGIFVGVIHRPVSDSGAGAPPGQLGSSAGETTDVGPDNIDDASSLDVVVDKLRPLDPLDWAPTDLVSVDVHSGNGQAVLLRRPAATAVTAMFMAFTAETGHSMESESAYRSYAQQRATFRVLENRLGPREALESAALPGYSEHQTGLAIDVGQQDSDCRARDCFAATAAGIWLRTHAWRFGFIIRYPAGQTTVTGYDYEPWHLRYLGSQVAKEVHFHASSLEEYFRLPAAPSYRQ